MPPFRPANLNKRAYPGNASVIGPTCATTLGITTSCIGITTTAFCAACVSFSLNLGCRVGGGCACACCCRVCGCLETVCIRTVPSGIYKISEQNCAKKNDSWPPIDTCSCAAAVCFCNINCGFTCAGGGFFDCKGFFICCGPSTNKWFVAPSCTEVRRTWYAREEVVTLACSCMGNCGWFVPTCTQLKNPGYCCRTYWDNYANEIYWSSTSNNHTFAWGSHFGTDGGVGYNPNGSTKHRMFSIRAFRCTA